MVAKLEAEIEIIKTQSRMIVRNTHLSFRDATYFYLGLSLLLPRVSSFSFNTDSGLGAGFGLGQYLGRHHVFEVSLSWDFYLALDVQYRFEFHRPGSGLTWGPVLGYRTRVAELSPFDNFLAVPTAVRRTFYYFGGVVGFPVSGGTLIRTELLYLRNVQQVISAQAGVHFFF